MPIIDNFNSKRSDKLQQLVEFIQENNIYRVEGKTAVYWYYDQTTKDWLMIGQPILHKYPSISVCIGIVKKKDVGFTNLYAALSPQHNDGLNRVVNGVYRGFEQDAGRLNIFNRGSWLQPEHNANHLPHPLFETLLTSISGGRQELKDHIEKCLLHKIRFPEEIRIPAMVMHGQGKVGKGLFADVLCRTIFTQGNVVRSNYLRFFTDINSILERAVVVYVDNFLADKTETDELLNVVGQTTITTRGVYSNAVVGSSLGWWFISNNNPERPPVILCGGGPNSEDRRWSVIKHKQGEHLNHWIEKSVDYQKYKEMGLYESTEEYYNDKYHVFKDPKAVSHWLGYLINKHGEPVKDNPPDPYHGPDYAAASNYCAMTHIRIADVVFKSDHFEEVLMEALFEIYRQNGGREFKDMASFGKAISKYVKDNKLEDVWAKNDRMRTFWYRRTDDGKARDKIVLNGNEPSVDIDQYAGYISGKETPVVISSGYEEIDPCDYAQMSRKRRKDLGLVQPPSYDRFCDMCGVFKVEENCVNPECDYNKPKPEAAPAKKPRIRNKIKKED